MREFLAIIWPALSAVLLGIVLALIYLRWMA